AKIVRATPDRPTPVSPDRKQERTHAGGPDQAGPKDPHSPTRLGTGWAGLLIAASGRRSARTHEHASDE
ncbi:MAG: hypothetical protein ACRDTJ_12995, partial [Pseudonocardiaceae bacterium]